MLPSILLFVSVAVTTPLRSGCEPGDAVVAQAPAGTAVDVRFALNGTAGMCYKVAVNMGGTELQGYLPATSLTGLDEFRKAVQSAPVVSTSSGNSRATRGASVNIDGLSSGDQVLAKGVALLDQNQPKTALEVLETGLKTHGRSYQMLVAAGMAAYRADDARAALDYLTAAEQMRPDPAVEQLIARIQKEKIGDLSGEKLYGTRFLLRYEGGKLSSEVARSMVAALEQEYSRISGELGCRTEERIVTVIQSREAYRASTDAAEWSGGLFDGSRIRIPVQESTTISPETRETFAHELVHACLASMGDYPTWLHEGMAQKLSGNNLSAGRSAQIRSMLRNGRMPKLENMQQSWSRLSREHAAMAYNYALAAVDLLLADYRAYGIQNVLRNPDRLPQITAELDRRLAEK